MRKLFTIDDLFIALVAAVGYGFSFEIPKILGYPEWLCIVVCLVVGTTLEGLAYKIVFSETVQNKPAYRFTAFAVLSIIFFVAVYLAATLGISVLNYVEEQFQFVIIPPLLIFAFNMALRQYRIKKIRKRYGDGSDGFVFDGQLKKSDLEELNRQNQQIHGAFDENCAVKTKTGVFVGQKSKDIIFSPVFPTPSLLSAPVAGKLLNRCRNWKMYSRRKISARPQFKSITTVRFSSTTDKARIA